MGTSKNHLISFFLTLLATLIGVLIAMFLTNTGVKNKEKEDSIKLLRAANVMLSNTINYSGNLSEAVLKLEKDTLKYNEEEIERQKNKTQSLILI